MSNKRLGLEFLSLHLYTYILMEECISILAMSFYMYVSSISTEHTYAYVCIYLVVKLRQLKLNEVTIQYAQTEI